MDNKETKHKKKRTLLQKIVNVFLYAGLAIFIILVLAFGFSQTSTFRNYLRNFVIETADSALNGNVNIKQIDGTIFTSLILKNTSINMGNDTLFKAGTISIKTSPLQLIFKKIYLRDFEIRDGDISLIKDKSGQLNLSRLIPPSKQTDTTKSSFPFTITVANFNMANVDLSIQDYRNVNSKEIYDSLNTNDLRLRNLNLSLSLFADINKNDFQVEIEKLNVSPNISSFFLNNFSGKFSLNEKGMEVNNLQVSTGRSNFNLDSKINNFNLFDSTSNFKDADINLNLKTDSLDFYSLAAFVPSLKILHGKVKSSINISGSMQKLNIDKLEIQYDSTLLQAKGNIKDLFTPEEMNISASFFDSYLNQSDINKILPSVHSPVYPQLGLLKFDTLTYKGNPKNFTSGFFIKTNKGNLAAEANLDFKNPALAYNINFKTINFDISPFAGINTTLNSNGRIKGSGTSPENLKAAINYNGDGSIVNGIKLDSLRLDASAESKNINYNLLASSDTMRVSLLGNMNFTDKIPSYKLKAGVNKFNAALISSDSALNSDVNLTLTAEGQNFEPDKMNLYLTLKLYNSVIDHINIDSTRAIVDLRSNDNGLRVVNIVSDLADITLTGKFSLKQTIALAGSEAALISNSIKDKINRVFPPANAGVQQAGLTANNNLSFPIDSSLDIQYLVDLKNFELISLFLGSNQLEVDGELAGEVKNSNDSVNISLKTRLDYIKYWGKKDIFFLSNFNLNFNLKNSLASNSYDNLNAGLHLRTDRVFAGNDIKNIKLDLDLSGDNAKLYLASDFENFASALLSGDFNLTGNTLNLSLDTLSIKYNNFRLQNKNNIKIAYSMDKIEIKNFVLNRVNGPGEISFNGRLLQNGNQDLKFSLTGFRGRDLSSNLLNLKPGDAILGSVNVNSEITGNFQNPLINMKLHLDSITYKDQNLGSLKGDLDYKNMQLAVDFRFIDSLNNYQNPKLLITGTLPMDLAFKGAGETLINDRPIDIKFTAQKFNLAAVSNVVPEVKQLRGFLNADFNISGNYKNLNPEGSLTLQNADFIADANNMEYYAGLKLKLSQNSLLLDSLVIQNSQGTKNGGRMSGSGKAEMENMNIKSSQFTINGSLKVLSDASKDVSPSVYGDLVIATNGNIQFTMDKNGANLQVPITVTNASLTFPPTQSAYRNNLQGYIYEYAPDTAKKDTQNLSFENLVKISQQRNDAKLNNNSSRFNFNYKVNVKVEHEAKIIFIISKELNQKLTAVLKGNFQYEKIGETPNAQGELSLLEGSNLQFFKTLSAEGSVRFESTLDNPYLNIVATYTDYYTPATSDSLSQGSSQEEKVAVKIKIQGPLKQLDKNFIQEKNNIAVYVGQSNIDNDQPDPQLDASDAVYFILTGSFLNPNYTGAQNNTGLAASASTSLAGSILGGFLSTYLGDYVRSVQVRRVGTQTKINLSGRVNQFRYSIGGSTNVFQDLSQANVMIEYPIFKNLLVRLERKEAISQTSVQIEMINELGLKYKFEF